MVDDAGADHGSAAHFKRPLCEKGNDDVDVIRLLPGP